MKRSRFRFVSVAVVSAVAALTLMQGRLLCRTYADMNAHFEQQIRSAMEWAAYTELVGRLASEPAQDRVSVGSLSGTPLSLAASQIVSISLRRDSVRIDTLAQGGRHVIGSAFSSNSSGRQIDILASDGSTYAYYLRQHGGRAGAANLPRLDSLFTQRLAESGLDLPHRMMIETRTGESNVNRDWMGDEPADPVRYEMELEAGGRQRLSVAIENPNRRLLAGMSGILLSSLGMVVLIAFSFGYLLRTLFRQKSIEEMRRDFTHNITHELKTPIAVAYAAADALLNFGAAGDAARRTKYLGVVRDQLDALSEMVQRILTMTVEEREEFRLHREPLRLGELFERLAGEVRLKAPKPVTVEIAVEPAALELSADRFHLQNLLAGLLDNAVKYSGASVRITLSACRTASATRIVVADDGIGIPRAAQARIFDKFYRVPTGDRHEVKGFGLGLYYARLIAAKHGGTIAVESAAGAGSRFILMIPDDER